VLDRVGVVRASLIKELLEVIHRRLRLTLGTAYVGLLVVATVVTHRKCGLLMTLLAPLLATNAALPSILDDDIERRFLAAAWGRVKLGRLIADDVLGVDATQLLGGVLDSVNRYLKGPYQWCVTRTASRHLSLQPLRVMAVFPPAARLIVVWVPCMLLRLRAHMIGPPMHWGLDMWALPLQ
jgi:hypothetical protein